MKAVQLVAPGKLEVRDIADPKPESDQVLLKVAAAGMCGSDLHIIEAPPALFDVARGGFSLPLTLGHETTARVVSVGASARAVAEASGLVEGAAVMVSGIWGCGLCRACEQGRVNACQYWAVRANVPRGPGLGFAGGMADYVVAPVTQLFPLGDLDPVQAAPLADAGVTPCHAINLVRHALLPDATVVVIGVGGLGHMALQILRATTSTRIIAVDNDPARLEGAKGYGADLTVRSDDKAADEILALTKGLGAEVVIDCAGVTPTLALGNRIVCNYGHWVIVGLGKGEFPLRATSPSMGGTPRWGVSVIRPYGATRGDSREVIALAQKGLLKASIEPYPLEQAPAVFKKLEHGEIHGRAVLIPSV